MLQALNCIFDWWHCLFWLSFLAVRGETEEHVASFDGSDLNESPSGDFCELDLSPPVVRQGDTRAFLIPITALLLEIRWPWLYYGRVMSGQSCFPVVC
jgi:hypothetical protein